jgi:3-deoxy-D-manno-octulosonic-acid transferase
LHHLAYNLLVRVARLLFMRKLARRAVAEPGYAQAVPERFGHYTQAPQASSELVWVHAVSMGEARAAAILIQTLRETLPGIRILLTHGTATGRAEGARWLRDGDVQVWQPWDTPDAVRAFLRHFRPRVGLLMETEVWPNLALQCRQASVPLALVNARMSEKSLRSALRWAGLMRPAYAALAAVWAQTEADAARLRQLGATVQAVTGNIKFDAQPDAGQCAQGQRWRAALTRPVFLLASSREGEEAMWLAAVMKQPGMLTAAHWLIVPRHPQRRDEVQALLQSAGLSVSRRSQWGDAGPASDAVAGVWLGDSMGEMALYYSLADAAALGGSFAPLGGQNLIEAAACACPVVMGPHTFNFLEVAQHAQATGAAQRVDDMDEALAALTTLPQGSQAHTAMAQAASEFAQTHKGAARRVAGLVQQMLA